MFDKDSASKNNQPTPNPSGLKNPDVLPESRSGINLGYALFLLSLIPNMPGDLRYPFPLLLCEAQSPGRFPLAWGTCHLCGEQKMNMLQIVEILLCGVIVTIEIDLKI